MNVKIFEKKRLPSRPVMRVPEQARQRSYDYSMGLSEDRINQPFVEGVSCCREAAPGTRTPREVENRLSDSASREFCTSSVTDGIAKARDGRTLPQVFSEVITDSIRITMGARCCDATVGIAGCDKSLTSVMMAGVRLNVPSIFIYGGSILPGKAKDRDGTVAGVLEADGRNSVGDGPDGDMISSDTGNEQLDRAGPAGERADWRPRQTDYWTGALFKQAQQVGSARLATVTPPGAKSEVIVYADQ